MMERPDLPVPARSRREFLIAVTAVALGAGPMVRTISAEPPLTKSRFVPLNAEQRQTALGSLTDLPAELKRAFDPAEHFEPMNAPEAGDWLAEHRERGQTFGQFVASRPNRPDARRSTIYFVPLGAFDPAWTPNMSDLEACATAYFQIPVKVLPNRPLDEKQISSRERSGRRQYLSTDFLKLLPGLLPSDGYAILGITMQDLYPDAGWNYVFGQASLRDRAGIYSFARYDPLFWQQKRTTESRKLLFTRSLGVLLHETCHMFGMSHCVYYRCLVNGCNNLPESDRTPLHLCPVCLRKLHHSVGFDVVARDEALLKAYRRIGMQGEAMWIEERLKFVKNF